MKTKFVIVCLCIVLLFCACAAKTGYKAFEFDDYKNAFNNINPTRYVRVTEIYSNEILLSQETKEHTKNEKGIYEKIVNKTLGTNDFDMQTYTEEYYYKNEKLWKKADNEWVLDSTKIMTESLLRLSKTYFENILITKSDKGSILHASVKQDMTTLFLQESPTFAKNVKISIKETKNKLTEFVMQYDSKEYQVIITVSYFYDNYLIDIEDFVQ